MQSPTPKETEKPCCWPIHYFLARVLYYPTEAYIKYVNAKKSEEKMKRYVVDSEEFHKRRLECENEVTGHEYHTDTKYWENSNGTKKSLTIDTCFFCGHKRHNAMKY